MSDQPRPPDREPSEEPDRPLDGPSAEGDAAAEGNAPTPPGDVLPGPEPIDLTQPAPDEHAWDLPQPVPATLVALWPGDDAPTPTEVQAAMRGLVGSELEIVDELESTSDHILWNLVAQLPGLESRVIIWSEPAQPLAVKHLDDPALAACRWVVGAELLLDRDAPLDDFAAVVRLLAGLVEGVPAVYDANTGQWHLRESLEASFLGRAAEPPDEVLWVVHAVTAGNALDDDPPPGQPEQTVWLYTSGLWRCGRPELEMLEIPARHVGAAVAMLNAVAGMSLEESLPAPGRPFEIGNNLNVVLQPWREVVPFLDPEAHGSLTDRGLPLEDADTSGTPADDGEESTPEDVDPEEDNPLAGVRAVICGPTPVGTYRRLWTWPNDAIDRIEADLGTLYQSRAATRRQHRLAQRTLPDFAMAFASLLNDGADVESDASPGFFAKVGFPADAGPETDHEHLWFRVLQLDGPRLEGRLLNAPQLIPEMTNGSRQWFDQGQVSWWHVIVRGTNYGPETAPAMTTAVDSYRGDQRAQPDGSAE